MGHELSNRVKELEKLDETRLAAIAGMYALKRRQKKFLITKHFKLGDLVLVFTIKEFAAKLSKRGKGPYVILGLSVVQSNYQLLRKKKCQTRLMDAD